MAAAPRSIFGVQVEIPDAWDNWSLYRFTASSSADARLRPGLLVPMRSNAELMPMASVKRHGPCTPAELAGLLKAHNEQVGRDNRTHRVLKAGRGTLRGADALWQDITFVDSHTQLQTFQRHVMVINEQHEAVWITLAGSMSAIDEMSAALGLTR